MSKVKQRFLCESCNERLTEDEIMVGLRVCRYCLGKHDAIKQRDIEIGKAMHKIIDESPNNKIKKQRQNFYLKLIKQMGYDSFKDWLLLFGKLKDVPTEDKEWWNK